jgi:hypothetical protein
MFWVVRLLVWLFGNRPRNGPGYLTAYTPNISQFLQKENWANLTVDNQVKYPCFRGILTKYEVRGMKYERHPVKRVAVSLEVSGVSCQVSGEQPLPRKNAKTTSGTAISSTQFLRITVCRQREIPHFCYTI